MRGPLREGIHELLEQRVTRIVPVQFHRRQIDGIGIVGRILADGPTRLVPGAIRRIIPINYGVGIGRAYSLPNPICHLGEIGLVPLQVLQTDGLARIDTASAGNLMSVRIIFECLASALIIRVQRHRRVTVEPKSINLVFSNQVGQLFTEPLHHFGISKVDVILGARPILVDTRPIGMFLAKSFDQRRLHRSEVEYRLGASLMDHRHKPSQVGVCFFHHLRGIIIRARPDVIPFLERVHRDNLVTRLQEFLDLPPVRRRQVRNPQIRLNPTH